MKLALFLAAMIIVVASYCCVYLSEVKDANKKIMQTREIIFNVVKLEV